MNKNIQFLIPTWLILVSIWVNFYYKNQPSLMFLILLLSFCSLFYFIFSFSTICSSLKHGIKYTLKSFNRPYESKIPNIWTIATIFSLSIMVYNKNYFFALNILAIVYIFFNGLSVILRPLVLNNR